MIEWKQDEYSELKVLAARFALFRSLYLKGSVFVLLIFALGLIAYLIDGQIKNFQVPAVIFVGMTLVYALLLATANSEDIDKTFFLDDEHVGFKSPSRRYQLKWEDVLGVETKDSATPNIELVIFKAKSTQLVKRPNLTMTIEKDNEVYGRLMEKIASRNLPVEKVRG